MMEEKTIAIKSNKDVGIQYFVSSSVKLSPNPLSELD